MSFLPWDSFQWTEGIDIWHVELWVILGVWGFPCFLFFLFEISKSRRISEVPLILGHKEAMLWSALEDLFWTGSQWLPEITVDFTGRAEHSEVRLEDKSFEGGKPNLWVRHGGTYLHPRQKQSTALLFNTPLAPGNWNRRLPVWGHPKPYLKFLS